MLDTTIDKVKLATAIFVLLSTLSGWYKAFENSKQVEHTRQQVTNIANYYYKDCHESR